MATVARAKKIVYPESDGQPLAETQQHVNALLDVYSRLRARYAVAADGYTAATMFVYYVEGEPAKVLAPDVFVAFGVGNHLRDTFKVWEEGVFPSVVFEFTSKSSKTDDMGTKFATYRDMWKVKEYFLFDPLEEYLEPSLLGYKRVRREFEQLPAADGILSSKVLGLTMERNGEMLLLRDAKTGQPLLLPGEQKAEDAERELAKSRAATDQLLAEVAKLKAELAALRKGK